MHLFKRILLSLFPENIVNQPINPASMFVSFISSKQFFSVINRKIVENYKLNLFDVALDSFDVKIWFWEQPSIKVKDIDFYYSYWVSANLNWYRFLAPWNIWSSVSLVSSIYVKDVFANYNNHYFLNFNVAVYLLTFIFISRTKVFPQVDEKEEYKWFIDVFFEFYYMVIDQTGQKIDNTEFEKIKKELLKNIQLFFMLYYYYKSLNSIFTNHNFSNKEYYSLLFYDELKKWWYKTIVWDFIDHSDEYTSAVKFSVTEKKVMNLIFPADILIRYIFEEDAILVVDYLVSSIFDKSILDKYMSSFLKNWDELENFIHYITDYTLFKKNYFTGLKNLVIHKFKNNVDVSEQENIDDFLSSVWDTDNIENIKVPERIKKESVLMEKFINFYVTYIWAFWISRWDTFFVRLFRKKILDALLNSYNIMELKQDALFFYGWLLYNYSKNVFYYKYAFDNVRAGKEKFNLPFRSTFREVYSNMFIIKLFNENFITTILQDINSKDIKIYLQNKETLNLFKKKFETQISKYIKHNWKQFIKSIYWDIDQLLKNIKWFHLLVHQNLTENDISNLKESIYTFDFQLWKKSIEEVIELEIDFSMRYSDFSTLWILAALRDSIMWFLIYYRYLQTLEISSWKDMKLDLLKKIYILDILWLCDEYVNSMWIVINKMINSYWDILQMWVNIDDNKKYFELWVENRTIFVENKTDEKIFTDIAWEDIIWFRWFLKNITFYNKRYLIPKQ